MTRRTIEAYVAALQYIDQYLIELKGDGIIIDFENAMRAAMKKVSPDIRIYGCLFHYMQALTRQMVSMKPLYDLIRANADAKFIFRKFQSLALLPGNLIKGEFISLLREALDVYKFTAFAPFVNYYKNQWLTRVKPVHFSVFKINTKTTGPAEAYNGKINKSFRTHGALFQFIEQLQKEDLAKSDQFSRDVTGVFQPDRRKKFDKKRSEVILNYSKQLEKKEITPKQFLSIMANINNEILYDEKVFFTDNIEINLSNETELIEGDDIPYVAPLDDESNSTTEANAMQSKPKRARIQRTTTTESTVQTRSRRAKTQSTTTSNMVQMNVRTTTRQNKRDRARVQSDDDLDSEMNLGACSTTAATIDDNVTQPRPKRARIQKTSTTESTVRTRSKSVRATTQPNNRDRAHVQSDDDSNVNLDSDSYVYEVMQHISQNGTALLNLRKRFQELEKQKNILIDPDCFKCILCYERKKNTILFPCLHQHTCNPCWIIWKIHQINTIPLDSSMGDEVIKPKCPVCKRTVDNFKEARN